MIRLLPISAFFLLSYVFAALCDPNDVRSCLAQFEVQFQVCDPSDAACQCSLILGQGAVCFDGCPEEALDEFVSNYADGVCRKAEAHFLQKEYGQAKQVDTNIDEVESKTVQTGSVAPSSSVHKQTATTAGPSSSKSDELGSTKRAKSGTYISLGSESYLYFSQSSKSLKNAASKPFSVTHSDSASAASIRSLHHGTVNSSINASRIASRGVDTSPVDIRSLLRSVVVTALTALFGAIII